MTRRKLSGICALLACCLTASGLVAEEIYKRVDLEAGQINYVPDFREGATSLETETLDMDGLFKRTRAEINALRNRRGRI